MIAPSRVHPSLFNPAPDTIPLFRLLMKSSRAMSSTYKYSRAHVWLHCLLDVDWYDDPNVSRISPPHSTRKRQRATTPDYDDATRLASPPALEMDVILISKRLKLFDASNNAALDLTPRAVGSLTKSAPRLFLALVSQLQYPNKYDSKLPG